MWLRACPLTCGLKAVGSPIVTEASVSNRSVIKTRLHALGRFCWQDSIPNQTSPSVNELVKGARWAEWQIPIPAREYMNCAWNFHRSSTQYVSKKAPPKIWRLKTRMLSSILMSSIQISEQVFGTTIGWPRLSGQSHLKISRSIEWISLGKVIIRFPTRTQVFPQSIATTNWQTKFRFVKIAWAERWLQAFKQIREF